MQWMFMIFLAVAGIICTILGLMLSIVRMRNTTARQRCAGCGWTSERVQFCEFEQGRRAVVAPLCFECTIKLEATPVRPRLRRSSGLKEIPLPIAG